MDAGEGPLATVTHARLRASQGDVHSARKILREILEREPWRHDARRLLDELEGETGTPVAEDVDADPPPPEAGDPALLARSFKRALGSAGGSGDDRRRSNLELWLARIKRGSGGNDVR